MPNTRDVYVFGSYDASSNFIAERYSNTKSDLIVITHDKLENILLKHLDALKYQREWQMPLSILITLIITFCTTTFNDFFLFKSYEWRSIFIIAGILSFIWLIYSIKQFIKYRKSGSIDSLINKIKAVDE